MSALVCCPYCLKDFVAADQYFWDHADTPWPKGIPHHDECREKVRAVLPNLHNMTPEEIAEPQNQYIIEVALGKRTFPRQGDGTTTEYQLKCALKDYAKLEQKYKILEMENENLRKALVDSRLQLITQGRK
jgi:hypothetical protein